MGLEAIPLLQKTLDLIPDYGAALIDLAVAYNLNGEVWRMETSSPITHSFDGNRGKQVWRQ